MLDEELEDDELDASIEVDDDEVDLDAIDEDDGEGEIDDSEDDGSDAVVKTTRAQSKAAAISEDLPSLAAKQKDRDALAKAMEEFLARGGKVQEVDDKIDV
ncbi:MAG TPA: hypothetical protein GX719_07240 [Gammaproteobacteria bacterium]|nr:hypothetical protein [Gammaproteobacteria bacterium]